MLEILKTPDWKNIVPLQYYLQPLEDAIDAVVKELLKMHKKGPLQCKYFIEKNEELMKLVCDMVRKDVTAQWLAGNELKRDQFKFMYKCQKILYDSALRDYLIADKKKSFRVLNDVLPMIIAFESLLVIRDIEDNKLADALKEKTKAARRVALFGEQDEDEKQQEEAENIAMKHNTQQLGKKVSVDQDPAATEAMRVKAALDAEIAKYGVSVNSKLIMAVENLDLGVILQRR